MSALPRYLEVKYFALAILVSLSLDAHANKKNPPPTLLCETDTGETEKSKVVVKTLSGHTLFACGKIVTKKGKTELSAFRVFVLNKNGKRSPGHVFQDSSDQNHYRLGDHPDALTLQELIWNGRERVPAFEIKLECSEAGCKKSAPACALQKGKAMPATALSQLRAYITGTKKGKVPEAKLIGKVAGLAYNGNAEALALFENRGNLLLDGDSADAYFDHQTMLQRLKNSGCL